MKTPKKILLSGFVLLLLHNSSMSQAVSSLCPNTALAPVFKQDFGQSATSSATSKAAAGSTNYNFGGVGTDGNYIITPLINNANKADWTKGGDHTGNTNGNMFLVNAGGGNSVFFKQTVTGLCTGSSYNFSAWIANVNTPNTLGICGAGLVYPKIVFNVRDLSGTILGTVTTGSLPLSPNNGPANWQQYGMQFSLPAGTTSLIIEMVDFYGGAAACGNDVALDDIVFSACTPQATVTLNSASGICAGQSTSIRSSLINNPFTNPAYQWQKSTDNGVNWINIGTPGTSAQNFPLNSTTPADNGSYRVLVGPDVSSLSSATCVTASNSISLTVFPLPVIAVTSNGPVCSGTMLSFNSSVTGTGPYQYNWSGPNAFSSLQANPSINNVTLSATGSYQLILTDVNGCSDTAASSVTVNPSPVLLVSSTQTDFCSGNATNINFSSSVAGSMFKWQSSVLSGIVTGNSNNSIPGLQNSIHDILANTSATVGKVNYTITVNTPAGCTASDSGMITVTANPSKALAGTDLAVCNTTIAALAATAATVGQGVWSQLSGPSSVSFSNISLNNTAVSGLVSGDYSFVWTVSNSTCNASADTVILSVLPSINNLIDTTSQTVCKGQTVTISAAGSAAGNGSLTYQWEKSKDGTNWFNIAGATQSSYSFVPDTTLFIRRNITSSGCTSQSGIVTVELLESLGNNRIDADQDICAGASAQTIIGSLPSGGDGNYSYQWEKSVDSGASWTIINGATGKDLVPSGISVITFFRRTVTSNTCNGSNASISNVVKITISKKAKANMQFTILNSCSPMKVSFGNQSAGDSAVYHLFFGDGTDSIISQTGIYEHTYHTGHAFTFPAKLTAENKCSTDSFLMYITVLPNPATVKMILKDTAVCGVPFRFTVDNQTAGASQQSWNWGDSSAGLTTNQAGLLSHTYLQIGNYVITNLINSGCSDSTVYQPLYIYPSVTAKSDTVISDACAGESVLFKNLSDPALSFEWRFGDGQLSNTANSTHRYSQAGNYTSVLKVWSTHPQLSCYDSSLHPVQIIPEKKGAFTISDTLGKCIPFTVRVINQSLPSLQTEWNWGDGSNGAGDTATHQYTRNGRFLITMHALQEGGCLFTDSIYVTISAPAAEIQFKGGVYCSLNDAITFLPVVTNTDSVRWDFGDGTTVTGLPQKISHAYTKGGKYIPKIQLLNTSTSCMVPVTASDTLYIDEVKTDFKLSSVYDCGKTTYFFTDSSLSVFPVTGLIWTMDQNIISTNNTYQRLFTAPGTHTTSLQVKTVYGCVSSLQASFSVGVYQYPKANIAAISDACLNNLMELKSIVNSTDSVRARFWNLGNGINATDSIVKVFYNNEGQYMVKLTVSTVNSCYDSAYKQITVHAAPAIQLSPEQILCKGDSLQLKANGAGNYIWKDQNNRIICSNCDVTVVQPNTTAVYSVIGYSEYGCSQVATTTVRVIQPFKLTVKTPDTVCIGNSKRLLVGGASVYQWQADPGLSNLTVATPFVTPTANTTYHVIGKDAYHCFADTAEIKIIVGNPTPVAVGSDTVVLSGVPVQLHANTSLQNIVQWKWAGNATYSCLSCPSPTAKVIFDECLNCTVTNIYGCVTSDTICIKTFCPSSEVFIPNAFSPDGDGINDLLIVQGRGLKMVKSFRVFNRWGEMVFEKTNFYPGDAASGWDGKIRGRQPSPDVYVYVCEVICERGVPATFKGNVAVLK